MKFYKRQISWRCINVSRDQSWWSLKVMNLLFLFFFPSLLKKDTELPSFFSLFSFSSDALPLDDDDDDDYDAIATVLLRRANIYHRVFEFGTESQGRRSIVHRGGYTSLRLSQKDDAWSSGQSGRNFDGGEIRGRNRSISTGSVLNTYRTGQLVLYIDCFRSVSNRRF